MASPIYDCAVRTSVVASGGALVPPAAALGTGRIADVTLSWTE